VGEERKNTITVLEYEEGEIRVRKKLLLTLWSSTKVSLGIMRVV
jgi:hypothetical protein